MLWPSPSRRLPPSQPNRADISGVRAGTSPQPRAVANSAHADEIVVRPTRTTTWNLVHDGVTVASAYAVCRPDRRWFVSVDGWRTADHDPLVNAMIADLGQDLYTRIDGRDPAAVELWSRFGFEPERREVEFLLSSDPARNGLDGALVPAGLLLLSAEEVDETALREIDNRIRADLPGNEGWVNDPAEFHDHVFDERFVDPASCLVAVDDEHQQFAGLVRIWGNAQRARLSLLGVARGYRRRGLARALLASALRPIHERGVPEVMAEADATNAPGLALLESLKAVETGSSMVLLRSR